MNINLKAPSILIRDFAKIYTGKEGNIINIIEDKNMHILINPELLFISKIKKKLLKL